MKEIFINEVVKELSTKLTSKQLNTVKTELSKVCEKYEIKKQSRALVVKEKYPQAVKEFIASRLVEGTSKNTLSLYELRLRQFFETVQMPIEKVTTNTIRVFLYKYKEENGISDRTLDTFRTIITVFFGWAAAEGYIDKNPCLPIRPIKYTKKKRKALTQTNLEELRNACKNIQEKAILEFLISTGCRVSELCDARIKNLDLINGSLSVIGKGKKERTVYLTPKAKILLTEYLGEYEDGRKYIFISRLGDKYSKNGIESLIKKIGERVNIDLHPHLLRHTTATLMLQSGADVTKVQRLLGHESLDTTMVYTNVLQEDVQRSHRIANI